LADEAGKRNRLNEAPLLLINAVFYFISWQSLKRVLFLEPGEFMKHSRRLLSNLEIT
jgi:hypothetical protein